MTDKEYFEAVAKDFKNFQHQAWDLPQIKDLIHQKNKKTDLSCLTREALRPSVIELIKPLQLRIILNWKHIVDLKRRGATWEDPHVLDCCDKTMALCNTLVRHTYEDVYVKAAGLEKAIVTSTIGISKKQEKAIITDFTNQGFAGCFNIDIYMCFYGWVRAYPHAICDDLWKVECADHPEWERQYATAGTLQHKWKADWEALNKLLLENYFDVVDERMNAPLHWPEREHIETNSLLLKPFKP